MYLIEIVCVVRTFVIRGRETSEKNFHDDEIVSVRQLTAILFNPGDTILNKGGRLIQKLLCNIPVGLLEDNLVL